MPDPPPPITHVLETCLYVKSMSRSVDFYTNIMHLENLFTSPRTACFRLSAGSVLLLFQLGLTASDSNIDDQDPSMRISGHGPSQSILDLLLETGDDANVLKQHFCFSVPGVSDVEEWEAYLEAKGVAITGRMRWENERGYSVYFADPDGHVGEVASSRLWERLS